MLTFSLSAGQPGARTHTLLKPLRMEQSRLRLLAEFENMRFGDRTSCEVMPAPGVQARTAQTAAPSRPHRLASLWGGLTSRTQSPFAQPAQQSRPFDSDTPIYSAKASLASLPKTQTPAVPVRLDEELPVVITLIHDLLKAACSLLLLLLVWQSRLHQLLYHTKVQEDNTSQFQHIHIYQACTTCTS